MTGPDGPPAALQAAVEAYSHRFPRRAVSSLVVSWGARMASHPRSAKLRFGGGVLRFDGATDDLPTNRQRFVANGAAGREAAPR